MAASSTRPRSTPPAPALSPQNVLADFIAAPVSTRPRSTGEALAPLAPLAPSVDNAANAPREAAREPCVRPRSFGVAPAAATGFSDGASLSSSFGWSAGGRGAWGRGVGEAVGGKRFVAEMSAVSLCSKESAAAEEEESEGEEAPIVFAERRDSGKCEDHRDLNGSDVENVDERDSALDYSARSSFSGRKRLSIKRLSMTRGGRKRTPLEEEEEPTEELSENFYRQDDYVEFGASSSRGVSMRSSRRASLVRFLPGGGAGY